MCATLGKTFHGLMDHKTLSKDDKTQFPTSCTTEHMDECPNMDAKTSPLDE